MNEEPSIDEKAWPQRCPHCGTQLQTAHEGFDPAGRDDIAHREMAEVVAVDFCPSEDCPARR